MNHPTIINHDVKSHTLTAGSRPRRLRFGYLLLAGLTTLMAVALLSGKSEPARAIQTVSLTLDEKESAIQTLALPQAVTPETVTPETVIPETVTTPGPVPELSTLGTPLAAPLKQAASLPEPVGNWRDVTIKSGDSLAAIFTRLGISPRQLHALLEQGGAAHNLKNIYPGQTLRLLTDDEQGLLKLSYPIDKLSTLEVNRNGDDFEISTTHRTPERREISTSATIESSLFMTGHNAGLSDSVIMELAGIFGWDIDFALDIRKGDQFTVLYEEIYLDGEHIDNGNILAAEFINQGKRYQAVRYTDAGGRTDYYALNGESMRKTFLRTPVEFSRISSRFSTGRKHPVLNKIRAHKGVDYAASTGTPIKSTANGKIIHIGKKGGYGNTIIVQHGTRYSTLYAHMSKYRGGLKNGSRIKQGQTIGYVGSTGLATGPHLHYELRVDGTHRDPLRVKLPGADPLNKKYMADFTSRAEALIAQIDLVRDVQVASNN
ncbi:MAG: peptidoglycan DD-metalloendopeptidase family protein [Gammaproteobacteria bacterium]